MTTHSQKDVGKDRSREGDPRSAPSLISDIPDLYGSDTNDRKHVTFPAQPSPAFRGDYSPYEDFGRGRRTEQGGPTDSRSVSPFTKDTPDLHNNDRSVTYSSRPAFDSRGDYLSYDEKGGSSRQREIQEPTAFPRSSYDDESIIGRGTKDTNRISKGRKTSSDTTPPDDTHLPPHDDGYDSGYGSGSDSDKKATKPARKSSKPTDYVSVYKDRPTERPKSWRNFWTEESPQKKLEREAEFQLNHEKTRVERIEGNIMHVANKTGIDSLEPEKYSEVNEAASVYRLVSTKIENMKSKEESDALTKKNDNSEKTLKKTDKLEREIVTEIEKDDALRSSITTYNTARTDLDKLQMGLNMKEDLRDLDITKKDISTISRADIQSTLDELNKVKTDGKPDLAKDIQSLRQLTRKIENSIPDIETWQHHLGRSDDTIKNTIKSKEKERREHLTKLTLDNQKIDEETKSKTDGIEKKYGARDARALNDIQVEESKASKKTYIEGKYKNMRTKYEENEGKLLKNTEEIMDLARKAFKMPESLDEPRAPDSPSEGSSASQGLGQSIYEQRAVDELTSKLSDRIDPYYTKYDEAAKEYKRELDKAITQEKYKRNVPGQTADESSIKANEDKLKNMIKIDEFLQEREKLIKEQRSSKDAFMRYGTDHQFHMHYYEEEANRRHKVKNDLIEKKAETESWVLQIRARMEMIKDTSQASHIGQRNTTDRTSREPVQGIVRAQTETFEPPSSHTTSQRPDINEIHDYKKLNTMLLDAEVEYAKAKGRLEKEESEIERLKTKYDKEAGMYKSDDQKEKDYLARIQAADDKTLEQSRNLQRDEIQAKNAMKMELVKLRNLQLAEDQKFMTNTSRVIQQLHVQENHYRKLFAMEAIGSLAGNSTNSLQSAGFTQVASWRSLLS